MNVHTLLASLVQYGIDKQLIEPCDKSYVINQLLDHLGLTSYSEAQPVSMMLEEILDGLVDDAVARGVCDDSITSRDLLDTRLMGALTPSPHEVRHQFNTLLKQDPQAATEWYYRFSQDTNYIRRNRIQRDIRWMTATEYGRLEITINLSKPEKDPVAIAAAKSLPQSGYPKCQLCLDNEGFAGSLNHPARQNHRVIPICLDGEEWYFQYSPYVYFNEHCIVFNAKHTPMKIDRSTFVKLLDFVTLFPHYFIGSNADLPIVGGSILTHEHFQGGRHTFAMSKAPIEKKISFEGYPNVKAGIVKWPLSVIRLSSVDRSQLTDLAEKILNAWRGYTDESAFVFAATNGNPHNTITPIARRNGVAYELDLVLRNNITTPEFPLGVFHPHAELHHIKKENIGLIEVMGLAVLPSRLKTELQGIQTAILSGKNLEGECEKHAAWIEQLKGKNAFSVENIAPILRIEVGRVFSQVLEHAGVFKRTKEGAQAFKRFINYVNQEVVK